MNEEQIKEYKKLKEKAELLKAKRIEGYQARKLQRATFKEYFIKHASASEKKALADKIAAL